MAFTGVTVNVQVMPHAFQHGIPSELVVSLGIADHINRQQQSEGIVLPLSTTLTPEQWYSKFELKEQAAERSYAIGETVDLGSVQENAFVPESHIAGALSRTDFPLGCWEPSSATPKERALWIKEK